jgi:hypothetical protein
MSTTVSPKPISELPKDVFRTSGEAAGHRPEPLSDGFLVHDPWHAAVAFVAHDQDEQSSPEQT